MALLNILWLLLAFIGAFLLGSIPFSVWIGRLATGVDLREKNIGNPGGFNAMITYGPIVGLSITFMDLSKGIISIAYLDHIFSMDYFATGGINYWHVIAIILGPAICVLGHNYSPWLKFKGGRGIGVYMGTMFYMNPLVFVCFIFIMSIFIQGLKVQSRFGNVLAILATIPIALFLPISPPWTNILDSLVLGASDYLFLAQGLIVFCAWLAILPKMWTGVMAAIRGKGEDWGFDFREGQDLEDAKVD